MSVADIIVVAGIVLAVGVISYPLLKRMRGGEDCCGNAQVRVRQKRLRRPAGKYTLSIEGMHCRNCAKRVTEAVNEIDGLACRVNLEKKEAVIFYRDTPRKEEVIRRLGGLNYLANG